MFDKITDWIAENGVKTLCGIGVTVSIAFIIAAIIITIGG